MSSLATLQQRFGGVLFDGEERGPLEAAVHGDARASAETRVAIYAEMYLLRLVEVVGEVYPKCRLLLGEERFDELAARYVRATPSRSPSLRGYGDRLPALLAQQDELPPECAALAALEWARYDLFDAIDEQPLRRETLAQLAPDAIAGLTLRPLGAARIIEVDHAVEQTYRALDGEVTAPPPTPRTPTTLLVWRQTPKVFHRALPWREAEVLRQLDGKTTLAALCEKVAADQPVETAAQEVFGLLGRWIADELIADLAHEPLQPPRAA